MQAQKRILVIGSANTDMVIKTAKFPAPGETLLGGKFFMFQGGKGANQAVAASRLGGEVTFIARVGNDMFGRQAVEQYSKEGINTQHIVADTNSHSGVALITVDKNGENTIVVAPGANGNLSPNDLSHCDDAFRKTDLVLLQLEIPVATVVHAAKTAAGHGKRVILNPAPAAALPDELYPALFLITPNKSETETLTGMKITTIDSVRTAAEILRKKGIANVVVTLGGEGAYLYNEYGGKHVPGIKVTAVDTTAAGDVFNGALSVALSEDFSLEDAVNFANRAAARSVTKMGAQDSAPFRNELFESKKLN